MKLKKYKSLSVLLLGILAAIAFWRTLSKGISLDSYQNTYYVALTSITDVRVQSPVEINGITVGGVTKIEPSSTLDTTYITIVVNKRYKLPKNSTIEEVNTDLQGTRGLSILVGNSTEIAENGDTLKLYIPDKPKLELKTIIKHLDNVLDNDSDTINKDSVIHVLEELQELTEPFKKDSLIH